jgi:hypothetical protein
VLLGVIGLGLFTGSASAGLAALPADASCAASSRSVNCDNLEEAEDYASKYCYGSSASMTCSGVGRECAVQDDGILCVKGVAHRRPHGGVSTGGGGAFEGANVAVSTAGAAVVGLGLVLMFARRRGVRN